MTSILGTYSRVLLGLLCGLLCLGFASNAMSADTVVDLGGEGIQRLEVGMSFVGYRSTMLFYTAPKQKVVLKLIVDNKTTKFPVTGTLYTFADDVTEEGLKKWLNNQHSDGLFADAPSAKGSFKLPAGLVKSGEAKQIQLKRKGLPGYDHYTVPLKIGGGPAFDGYKLKAFSDVATVHVKK